MITDAQSANTRSLGSDTLKTLRIVRNTVESIGIAVVLAFVLRAFTIEAFVIPTGSMATRLLGAHWHLQCTECGYEFDYGWPRLESPANDKPTIPVNARCPNCRVNYSGTAQFIDGGDRVLVLKYLYNFQPPKPWDVVVFRNPQNNAENYIKRLIALPGETVHIVHGDVWVQSPTGSEWTIRRKPQHVQDVMWQLIHDNDYQPATRGELCPWWAADPSWTSLTQGRAFAFSGEGAGSLTFNCDTANYLPRYGYNDPTKEAGASRGTFYQDICTDLKVSCVFTPESDQAQISLLMDVMDESFRLTVSADGTVQLFRMDKTEWLTTDAGWEIKWDLLQETKLSPLATSRGTEIALAHVDWQAKVLIDGKVLLTSTDADDQYPPDYEAILSTMQQAYDRTGDRNALIATPKISILAEGGPSTVSHMAVHRDVYYTLCRLNLSAQRNRPFGPESQYARTLSRTIGLMVDGQLGWGVTGRPLTLNGDPNHPKATDSFFVLGDNSPQSIDSRHWSAAAPTLRLWEDGKPVYQLGTVPRYQMIGKAVFVYWPGGFRLPLPGGSNLPLIPNFGRMRPIH